MGFCNLPRADPEMNEVGVTQGVSGWLLIGDVACVCLRRGLQAVRTPLADPFGVGPRMT